MSVKINIPPHMQSLTNNREAIEVAGSSVGECLHHLIKQFPDIEPMLFADNGKLLGDLSIYVNGEEAYPEGLSKIVKDGDELHIPYIIVGG